MQKLSLMFDQVLKGEAHEETLAAIVSKLGKENVKDVLAELQLINKMRGEKVSEYAKDIKLYEKYAEHISTICLEVVSAAAEELKDEQTKIEMLRQYMKKLGFEKNAKLKKIMNGLAEYAGKMNETEQVLRNVVR